MRRLFLLYHEVRNAPSSYSYVVQREVFAEHLALFARLRANGQQAVQPEITLDDGHLSGYEYAAPLLAEHGLRAHFFITAGWTGRRAGYMEPHHLRALHAEGHRIGAHGWSHALLSQCSPDALEQELVQPRAMLEEALGAPVTSISLPGGRSHARVLAACGKAGYTQVFTSVPGTVVTGHEAVIPRVNVRAETSAGWLERLLAPDSPLLASLERQHRLKAAGKRLLGDKLYAGLWAVLNKKEPAPPDPAP